MARLHRAAALPSLSAAWNVSVIDFLAGLRPLLSSPPARRLVLIRSFPRVVPPVFACPQKQGPNLFGLVGRNSGSVAGYSYTKANSESGIKWSVAQTHTRARAQLESVSGFS